MKISKSKLRKLIREQLGIEFYFSRATKSLSSDPYFGRLVESACQGTSVLFGSIVPDPVSAELWVAKKLSEYHTGGPLVFAYGSRSKRLPGGFSSVPGVPGLFIPTERILELKSLTDLGRRDLNRLINHHKPDVIIWDSGTISEVEVKHTKRKTFKRIPSASRTDYDYYVLISENKTFFLKGDDYRRIAKRRHAPELMDIDFSNSKKSLVEPDELHNQIRSSIDELGSEKLSETLVNAIMHRLVPRGKKGQMTLPFSIDGHKVRMDLKLENKVGKKILKEVTESSNMKLTIPELRSLIREELSVGAVGGRGTIGGKGFELPELQSRGQQLGQAFFEALSTRVLNRTRLEGAWSVEIVVGKMVMNIAKPTGTLEKVQRSDLKDAAQAAVAEVFPDRNKFQAFRRARFLVTSDGTEVSMDDSGGPPSGGGGGMEKDDCRYNPQGLKMDLEQLREVMTVWRYPDDNTPAVFYDDAGYGFAISWAHISHRMGPNPDPSRPYDPDKDLDPQYNLEETLQESRWAELAGIITEAQLQKIKYMEWILVEVPPCHDATLGKRFDYDHPSFANLRDKVNAEGNAIGPARY